MDYIGYKHNKQIGVAPAIVTAAVKAIPALLPSLSTWVSGWFPAGISGKEQRIIDNAKSSFKVLTSNDRLLAVVGLSNQLIVPDVIARDLFVWYRKNYPTDYQTLSYDTMVQWNQYMDQFPQLKPDRGGWQDRIVQWTQESKFNQQELNYSKKSTASILPTGSSSSNLLMYGALGLGAYLLIKKKKK